MIILKPFPPGELHDEILRTTVKAEVTEEIAGIGIFRFYTVDVIEDKRNDH